MSRTTGVTNRAAILLAICAATIVYGSFYDWRFRVPRPGAWSLFWHTFYLRSEFALNVILYVPLGYVALAAFGRPGWAALFGVALSATVEAIQPLFGRMSQAIDIVANGAGTLCGVAVAEAARRLRGRVVLPPRPAAALAWWVLSQTYPFARRFALPLVWTVPGGMRPMDLATGVVHWAAFFTLAAAAVPRSPYLGVALASLVGPAKPFVSGRVMSMGEWCAWGVALLGALVFARMLLARPAAIGFALAAAVLLMELAPYRPANAPVAFNWTPFQALLSSDWTSGTLIAARKAFEYGALVYLLGVPARFGRATLAVCGGLCALEWLQRWLPGRTPDITDPVIAAMLGVVIWLLPESPRAPNTLK